MSRTKPANRSASKRHQAPGQLYSVSSRKTTYVEFAGPGLPAILVWEPGAHPALFADHNKELVVHTVTSPEPTHQPLNALFHAIGEVSRRYEDALALSDKRVHLQSVRGSRRFARGMNAQSKVRYALKKRGRVGQLLEGTGPAQGAVLFNLEKVGGRPAVLQFAYYPSEVEDANAVNELISQRLSDYAKNSEQMAARAHMFNSFMLASHLLDVASSAEGGELQSLKESFPLLFGPNGERNRKAFLSAVLLHDYGKDRKFLIEHSLRYPYMGEESSPEKAAHWATQNGRTMAKLNTPAKTAEAVATIRREFVASAVAPGVIPNWLESFVKDGKNHEFVLTLINYHDKHASELPALVASGRLSEEQAQILRFLPLVETYEGYLREQINEHLHAASGDAVSFGEQWGRIVHDPEYWNKLHQTVMLKISHKMQQTPGRFDEKVIALLDRAAVASKFWEKPRRDAFWFAQYSSIHPLGIAQ